MDKGNARLLRSRIVGVLVFVLGLFWVYDNIRLFLHYQEPGLLFAIRYPNWVLIVQVALGFLNSMVGVKIAFRKITIAKGLITFLVLCVLGILVNQFYGVFY